MAKICENCQCTNWFFQFIQMLGIAATGIAAVVALFEYLGKAEQDRKVRTFSYLDRYNSVEMVEVRSTLGGFLRKNFDSGLEEEEREEQLAHWLSNGTGLIVYDTVVEFFDTVYICVEVKGCDKATFRDIFSEEAKDYFVPLYHIIESRAQENSRHGVGIMCLATKFSSEYCP